jgi:long-subunit acyl-CoA synthetase (AMP-forming)
MLTPKTLGLNIFTKYYNDKKATDEAFTPDFGRWFKTGDVAKIDSTGQLHIVGRDKDTIVVNG